MNKPTKETNDELADLQAKCDEYLAGWKRAQADYQNLEKEYAKRMGQMAEYASAELAAKLLPVIDHYDLALEHLPAEIADTEWAKGLFQVKRECSEAIANLGIRRLESLGKKFDHNLHEAVGHEPSAEVPEDHIIKEIQPGYQLQDRLIRPAKVIVSKG